MAYASSTFTTIDTLYTALNGYATGLTSAWATDLIDLPNDILAIKHVAAGIYVQLEHNSSDIAIHQSLSYDSSAPGANPDDSGSGGFTANDRRVNGVTETGTRTYHFFHIDGSSERYIHAVIEYAAGLYRHFGFGQLDKDGDWVGGQYAYAHYWDQLAGNIDNPLGAHTYLIDGNNNVADRGATIHAEDLEDMDAASKWLAGGRVAMSPLTDTAGEDRYVAFGEARSGPYTSQFGMFQPSNVTGLFPMIPNHVWYVNKVPAINRWTHLGVQPDVRIVSMKNFQAGDIVTVGGNDWMLFPVVRKQILEADTEESWNAGIAYRKT